MCEQRGPPPSHPCIVAACSCRALPSNSRLPKVLAALILNVVPVHGRQHDVVQVPLRHRFGHLERLVRVDRRRRAGVVLVDVQVLRCGFLCGCLCGCLCGTHRLVFTEQNEHPLVHVSPMIIIVAVAFPSSPPLQHSPMLGHLASSQTVARLDLRTVVRRRL